MKKNYHAPQLKCFHLQGGSPMFAGGSRTMVVSTNDENNKTSGTSGSWSKEFWGLTEDDEDDSDVLWD